MLKQKEIDQMVEVSKKELSQIKHLIRNYVVYAGTDFSVTTMQVHIGLACTNHLEAIEKIVLNEEQENVYKVLEDKRTNSKIGTAKVGDSKNS